MVFELTEREIQVIELLAENLTFPQIGEQLGVSSRTARDYGNRARLKLGVKTARELPNAYLEATGENPWPT